jgi:hypothetical protein
MPRPINVIKGIKSDPPTEKKKVKNIWWDPDSKELVWDIED